MQTKLYLTKINITNVFNPVVPLFIEEDTSFTPNALPTKYVIYI